MELLLGIISWYLYRLYRNSNALTIIRSNLQLTSRFNKNGNIMEALMELLYGIIFLFILYLIIKTAVTKGIDDSRVIKELKNEIKELKKQKAEEKNSEEFKHIINRKA